MMDRASFHALLADRLFGLDRTTAVELHLHGGESFFLCRIRGLRESFAICEMLPMDEDVGSGSAYVPVREAAVPYTTISDLVVSARSFDRDHPAGFRGIADRAGITRDAASAS